MEEPPPDVGTIVGSGVSVGIGVGLGYPGVDVAFGFASEASPPMGVLVGTLCRSGLLAGAAQASNVIESRIMTKVSDATKSSGRQLCDCIVLCRLDFTFASYLLRIEEMIAPMPFCVQSATLGIVSA